MTKTILGIILSAQLLVATRQSETKKASTSELDILGIQGILIFGQDNSFFAQYLLGSKTWVGLLGRQAPIPYKSEGDCARRLTNKEQIVSSI